MSAEDHFEISDLEPVEVSPFRHDPSARRAMALVLVATVCVSALVAEVSLAIEGGHATEMVAIFGGLCGLAAVALAFYFRAD